VYQTSEEIYVNRAKIQDVACILSVEEVESGRYVPSCRGGEHLLHPIFLDHGVTRPFQQSIYFSRYFIAPFNVRLFKMLNPLSQHLR
jgi:hypothetical protein